MSTNTQGFRDQGGQGAPRRRPAAPRPEDRRAPPPRKLRRKNGQHGGRTLGLIFMSFIGVIFLLFIAGFGSMAFAYNQIAGDLKPRLAEIQNHKSFESSRIYDRNGKQLFEIFGEGRREPVKLEGISKHLINATISIEDKTFYENTGVDYMGIARAFYQSVIARSEVSGASTITQQLIKNVVLTDEELSYEKRYERKLKEIIMAQELNRQYSKDEVLELYLNEIPYGNLAYGIQAAAKSYFGVDANKLTLAQASLLAGLPQSPSRYNPIQFLEGNKRLRGLKLKPGWRDPSYELPKNTTPPKGRQVDVLRQMVDEGYITESQAVQAAAQDLIFADQRFSLEAPHFVFFVKEYLEKKYGADLVSEGGLRITTTLDLEMQQIAQEEAAKRIEELEADERNIHNAAVVVLQPNTGQILAMVGSVGYTKTLETTTPDEEGNVLDGNVNVTTALRQPGSALKPFTYLTGIEQNLLYAQGKSENAGFSPRTLFWDVETRFPVQAGASERNIKSCVPEGLYWYCPYNFDRKWHGPMRMRMALDNSLNMPAVKALKIAGGGNMINLLHRSGVASTSLANDPSHYGLSLTLGGGEVTALDLATAYNTLASGGRYFPANPILKITNTKGKVLEEFVPQPVPEPEIRSVSDCEPPTPEEYAEGKRIPTGTQCIDSRLVYIITQIMADNEARTPMFGTNHPLRLSRPAAVKTGTSEDFRDAWASGFTPFLTVTVWTGNNNNERTARVESTAGGGVIWNRTMERIFRNERLMQLLAQPFGGPLPSAFPKSYPGVISKEVCEIPGSFGGPTSEFFVQEIERLRENNPKAVPEPAPFDASEMTEKVISWSWSTGELDNAGLGLLRGCGVDESLLPTPAATETITPTVTPEILPTPTLPPGLFYMPDLSHYGENQAKAILGGLGITPDRITVQYQSRSKLGPLFDQYAAFAVVSSIPAPGSIIDPNATIILGIRSLEDDGGGQPTLPPTIPPEQPTTPPEATLPPEPPPPEPQPTDPGPIQPSP